MTPDPAAERSPHGWITLKLPANRFNLDNPDERQAGIDAAHPRIVNELAGRGRLLAPGHDYTLTLADDPGGDPERVLIVVKARTTPLDAS